MLKYSTKLRVQSVLTCLTWFHGVKKRSIILIYSINLWTGAWIEKYEFDIQAFSIEKLNQKSLICHLHPYMYENNEPR